MLNSILFGPFSQIEHNRDIYTAALSEAGHSEAAIQAALQSWGVSRHIYVAPTDAQALREAQAAELWYQQALARFLVPEHIEAAPPYPSASVSRALADRLTTITWEQLVAETVLFGSPERIVDQVREMEAAGVGRVAVLDEFRGAAPRPG